MTVGRVLLGTVVTALLVVWPSVPVGAHTSYVASWPAVGQVVTESPDRLTIELSTEVLPDVLVAVVDAEGRSLLDGDPVVQGEFVTQALLPSETAGPYAASFQVVGSDRHPIVGRVDFVVDPDGAATENPAGAPPDLGLDDDQVATAEEDTDSGNGSGPLLLLGGLGGVVALVLALRLTSREG